MALPRRRGPETPAARLFRLRRALVRACVTVLLHSGRIAQLVRASGLHPEGRGFETLFAHPRARSGYSRADSRFLRRFWVTIQAMSGTVVSRAPNASSPAGGSAATATLHA